MIDVDATLIGAHSEEEGAASTFKGGFGFHPLLAFLDGSRESLAAILRAGSAGANTADDHIAVVDHALEQIPRDVVESARIVVRTDSAGATHEFLGYLREGQIGFLCGFDLTESVRAAILDLGGHAWAPALRPDESERDDAQVAEITGQLDLTAWPQGSRVIVRRERPRPARSCRSPTMTGTASSRPSPTRLASRPSSSGCTARAPAPRTASTAQNKQALRTCRSASLRSTRSGSSSR